jgi:hypothetical protein
MTTQYTTILKLALPVQGELSGTWGDVVNDNITQMVEQAIAGKATINSWTANAHTLTTADGTTSESRCAILELTDTGTALTGAGTVTCPTNTKLYIVDNNTAEIITIKTAAGTGVAVPVGKTMLVYCDGTNVVEGVTHANSLSLGTSTVTVDSVLDQDDMSSDSATALATQQSIKAYVDSQVGTVDTLAEILANGNTTGANDIEVDTTQKVQFRDTAIYVNSSVDGQLDIVADGEVQIDTALVDINGNLDVSGTTNIGGSVSFTKNAIAGVAISTTSRASNTVTVTTSAVHGLTSGDLVNINGVADTSFNGYFTVAVSSTTVFTYSQTGADGSSTGGTSTEVVYNLNASGTALNWMNGPLNIAANSGIDGLEITQSGAGNGLHVTGTTGLVGNVDVTGTVTATSTIHSLSLARSGDVAGQIELKTASAIRSYLGASSASLFTVSDATFTPKVTIDSSGNVGIGVVPSAYDAIFKAIDVGQASNGVSGNSGTTQFTQGMYYNSGYKYGVSSIAVGRYEINLGVHKWTNAVAGTAGDALTSPTTVMTLDASGNLLLNTTANSGGYKFRFNGVGAIGDTDSALKLGRLDADTAYLQATSDAGVAKAIAFMGASEYGRFDASGQLLLGRGVNAASGNEATRIQFYNTNSTYDIASIRSEIGAGQVNRGELAFAVNNGASQQEAMRIDYLGNLLVGTTSAFGTTGTTINQAGLIYSSADGDRSGQFDRTGVSDGEIVRFTKAGTTVGSIGTDSGGNLQTLSSTGNYRFGDSDTTRWSVDVTRMYPMLDATYDIGLSSNRVRDLYLSGGAKLVADSAASAEIQLKQTGAGGRDYRISSTGSGYGSAGALAFYDATASSERARFDASGNFMVGRTNTSFGNTGHLIAPSGFVYHERDGGDSVMYLNRLSSDGDIVRFYKDSITQVGSIGVNNGVPYLSGPLAGGIKLSYYDATNGIIFPVTTTGAIANGTHDLGYSAAKFRDLYLSGGVYFDDAGGSGTTSSNYLDAYEEGTWTPVIKDTSATGTTVAISTVACTYTKIGRIVTLVGSFNRNDTATLTGNLVITGLPFTATGGQQMGGNAWVDNTSADILCQISAGNTSTMFLKSVDAPNSYVTTDDWENGRPLYFTRTYQAS